MKIYTKTGDKGQTSLVGGKRVSKGDLRLETYGTVDELNAYIGLLRAKGPQQAVVDVLGVIQNKLFNLGAFLATEPEKVTTEWMTEADVCYLEGMIDTYTAELSPLRGFILPAGNEPVALAHICRTITRRLERCMVRLACDSEQDRVSLQYVNRLSDLFFVLARKIGRDMQIEDFLWEK